MAPTTFADRVATEERMLEHMKANQVDLDARGLHTVLWISQLESALAAVKEKDRKQEALKAELKATTADLNREDEAAWRRSEDYLRQLGYTVIARNYRCRSGEVDLVAIDDTTLVFVEVKTRSGKTCGSPLEAVDARKQRRLAAAAQHFLVTQRCGGRLARFDVIGVLWRDGVPDFEHVPNAFELG